MKASTWFKIIGGIAVVAGSVATVFHVKKAIDRRMVEAKKNIIENDTNPEGDNVVEHIDDVVTQSSRMPAIDELEKVFSILNSRRKNSHKKVESSTETDTEEHTEHADIDSDL